MTVLHRTDLTTSQKIECAAAAVARQHEHGSKTALSETYEISRPTVYAVGATAESVLRTHFEAPLLGGAGVTVRIDDAQLRRAVVALRVLAPNAIRPIVADRPNGATHVRDNGATDGCCSGVADGVIISWVFLLWQRLIFAAPGWVWESGSSRPRESGGRRHVGAGRGWRRRAVGWGRRRPTRRSRGWR